MRSNEQDEQDEQDEAHARVLAAKIQDTIGESLAVAFVDQGYSGDVIAPFREK